MTELYPTDPRPFEWPQLPDYFVGFDGLYLYAVTVAEFRELQSRRWVQRWSDHTVEGVKVYEPKVHPNQLEAVLRQLRHAKPIDNTQMQEAA